MFSITFFISIELFYIDPTTHTPCPITPSPCPIIPTPVPKDATEKHIAAAAAIKPIPITQVFLHEDLIFYSYSLKNL